MDHLQVSDNSRLEQPLYHLLSESGDRVRVSSADGGALQVGRDRIKIGGQVADRLRYMSHRLQDVGQIVRVYRLGQVLQSRV